jgi:cytochrome c-type biogenesis protein
VTGSVLLPIGLGLLGFIEPCAIGAHLAFIGVLAERTRRARLASTLLFTLVRTFTMGALGIVAAIVGHAFAATQKTFWLVFGLAYVGLGALYLLGKAKMLMWGIGPKAVSKSGQRNVALLGLPFGLSIPACAAPLLFAASGAAAGAATMTMAFVTMALFGLALSAPLVVLVAAPGVTERLRDLAGHGRLLRLSIGWVLVAAGLWSVWFGLFVDPTDWR